MNYLVCAARRITLAVAFVVTCLVGLKDARASEAEFDLIFDLGVSRLALAEQLLRTSADFLAENPEISSMQGHVALSGILNGSPYFRSILALNADGTLLFDSYNPFPFLGAGDLSDREYFQRAANSRAKDMLISGLVVGRQSGQPFIPMSMAVPGYVRRGQPVVMLTVPPETLLPRGFNTPYRGVSILHGGDVIASSQPLSEINRALLEGMEFAGFYGAREVEIRGMPVAVHWRKSERYDVIFVYYDLSPQADR